MKVAVCGLWHVHARDYLRAALKEPTAEVVGVWDENPEFCAAYEKEYGVKVFDSLEALLNSDAEGVIVTTATNEHPEIICRIADAGKAIFSEKVLALSNEDADKIEEAVNRNGVTFVISLPRKYEQGPQTVKAVVDTGELGKLNYLRFRNCHTGSIDNWLPAHFYNEAQCGGGAMIDLGAHGMYMTDWICGVPTSFTSVFKTACSNEAVPNTDKVEDNAITMMGFDDGCIALNETGFVSRAYPMSLEVGGENGWVRFDNTGVHKATKATGLQYTEVPMEPAQPEPIVQFLTGKILPGCGMTEAKHLTYMMVEAYRNKV